MTELHHVCLDCGTAYETFRPWPADAREAIQCGACGGSAYEARIIKTAPAPAAFTPDPPPSAPAPSPPAARPEPEPTSPRARPAFVRIAVGLVVVLYIAACFLPAIGEKWPKLAIGLVFLIIGAPLFFTNSAFPLWVFLRFKYGRAARPWTRFIGGVSLIFTWPGFLALLAVSRDKLISGGAGLLIVPVWLANPLLWMGVYLLHRGQNFWAFVSGAAASAFSLLWFVRLYVRDETIYSGYVCWQASILVFTVAAFVIMKSQGKRTDW